MISKVQEDFCHLNILVRRLTCMLCDYFIYLQHDWTSFPDVAPYITCE